MPEIGLFGSEGGAPTTGVPTLSPNTRDAGARSLPGSAPRLGLDSTASVAVVVCQGHSFPQVDRAVKERSADDRAIQARH